MKQLNDLQMEQYFEHPWLAKADSSESMPPAQGVQQSYKDAAHSGANVMFRAKIKGHTQLDDNIPLHMTLKTFDKPHEMPVDEIASKVKDLGIERPDPHSLKYEPTIFTSKRNGNTYYMLKVHGTHPSYQKFNDHFAGQGITHDNFMAHVTINKDLYDKIKKEGLHPHEVEFSPLMIEHGANNPTHMFSDSQSHRDSSSEIVPKKLNSPPSKLAASEELNTDLQKGLMRHVAAGIAAAGIMATGAPAGNAAVDQNPQSKIHEVKPSAPMAPKYDRANMLRAIASVESSGGKDMHHVPMGGMHHGETAFGKYGLTPVTIRETIKLNRDLAAKHSKAALLNGDDLKHYVQDNPGLEDQIAEKHIVRLEHHFGQSPSHIAYGWLNGVSGTYKADKQKKNLDEHWHVKKVNQAYNKPARLVSSK